ncbi:hypothetical protein H0H87_002148 [Tephrocybe sp. NHM501043]|nr:hypothetical protein H0H87_002148 [Tephrocybe sp. NHM501043]
MDAAKWTFTSTQLQGIVSRAIRQSSEASAIRLLLLETLDEEIPAEVARLERAREEAKGRYGALARRRGRLFDALLLLGGGGGGQEGEQEQEQGERHHHQKRVEELKEVCGELDRAAEALHSAEEQLGQLAQLTQGHSTSALAMALRKLNASFLKQFAEAQSLRAQVESLQAERDDAWEQAEQVANEYEDLRTGRVVDSPADQAENRFERVMAVRKSSTRAARAGLRPASSSMRSNHRASAGSSGNRTAGANPNASTTPSSARTAAYVDDPPPVPPIPRRRPVDIMTNLPLRSSAVTGVSTEFPTPNSETRALVRAQDELYDMLGIPVTERSRRSRSVIGLPGDSEPAASPSYSHYDAPPNTGRRASLPPSAPLPPDPYALSASASIWTSDRAGWI